MSKGRPPKPREQKILEGNPGRRPLPEPVPGLGKVLVFPPPDSLSEYEAEVWRDLVTDIAALGWVDRIDRKQLEQLVYAYALVDELRADVAEHGVAIESTRYDKDGNEIGRTRVLNPAVRALISAQSSLRQLAGLFGLTPSDRAKLGYTVVKGASIAREIAADDADIEIEPDDMIEIDDE